MNFIKSIELCPVDTLKVLKLEMFEVLICVFNPFGYARGLGSS